MAYDPSIFNINPYYDDFSADNGFLRVLFKPGYALQAREATQLQSILQNQLSRIGDHLFKDGSRIIGGGISVRNSSFLMVDAGANTPLAGVTDYSTLVGAILTPTNTADTTQATVVHYIAPDVNTDGYLILVVDFVSGTLFTSSFNLTTDAFTVAALSVASSATYAQGNCKLITVSDGIFYVDGFFVRTETQQFTPYTAETGYRDLNFTKFSTLSKKIGFAIGRDNVTEQENSTLRDPAIGSYNYNAPGADRYKIILSLAQAELSETPNDFVELLRFENGKITKKIERITYGEIQKALALRTYDESGSYTVRPFDITVKPYDATNYSMSVGEGKAYVLGYEVENQHPVGVSFAKARTTQYESTLTFPFSVGTYIGVCMGNTATGFGETFATNLTTISAGSALVQFRNAANTATVATGYVHGAVPTPEKIGGANGKTGNYYRLYLYGVSGSVASGSTGYIYSNTTGFTIGQFTAQTSAGFVGLTGTNNSTLVYPLQPGYAVDDVSLLSIVGKLMGDAGANALTPVYSNGTTTYTIVKSHFTSTISSPSVFKFLNYGTTPSTNTTDVLQMAFANSSSTAFIPSSATLSTDSTQSQINLSMTGVPAGFTASALRAMVPVIYTPTISDISTFRIKTATSTTTTFNSFTNQLTDENGRRYYKIPNTDVYSIASVVNNTTPTTDYTDDFELDDGQRDTHYDNSRLYLKESAVATVDNRYTTATVTLKVTYSYFVHGGLAAAPFIGQHSYIHSANSSFTYEQIPLYTSPRTGKTVSLANCLDFRHSGLTNDTPMLKPYGRSEFGGVQGDTTVSYSHYLPRIDKLCVKADPEDGSALFFFVQGTPDLAPSAPPDPADALVLATITVPAYTHNAEDVVVTPVDTKRFTMADIGKIQKRVDEVEVFAKLSLSESEIEARSLRGTSAAAEPLKTSIFSDEFYGHSISDVTDSTTSCSIDYERGELRPFFTTSAIGLPAGVVSGATISSDGLMTLNYSSSPYITNNQYTTTVSINPSNTVNWLGFMKLSTSVDPYYDTGYRPVVKTNALSENDNWISCNANNDRGFGTQWNEWESLWTGIEQVEEEQDDIQKRIVELPHVTSDSAIPSFNSGSVRVGVSRKVESIDQKNSNFISARKLKNRIRHTIGSRVVDRSVVPYMGLQNSITATVNGIKPNATNLSLYFDGEVVKSGITTNAYGACTVSFGISAGSFLAGQRTVRISDSAETANATIAAEAVYYCTGLLEQRSSGSYSTRPPELRRQTAASETISKDPFNRDIDSIENTHWSDPLSQTFFVDKKANPDGIFLSSLNLYFSSKDSALPVTVQVRPTVSGYPSPSVVLPFSTVTKLPTGVSANSAAPTATGFTFSSPVYLEPGEYSICVLTNSDKYKLFAAQSAINALANSGASAGRAGNSQLVGTLFSPQGFGAAVENNNTDLMFKLNRCEFVSSGTVTYTSATNCTNAQILKFYAPEIVPTSCQLARIVDNTRFTNNQSIYLTSLFGSAPTVKYTLTRGVSTTVSPVVDTAAMYAASFTMYASPASPVSKYVSRVVDLPEDTASNGVAVFVDSNIPTGTTVNAYFRYSLNGEADIFTKTWILMTRTNAAFTSTSEIDFREAAFRSTVSGIPFKSYQVRVDLASTSANSTYFKTPAARNIRTVSFIQ
tara:strand:- start:55049 stop:59992 length:4944 start_codon:yes stop_codon:yes gene_type:complete